MQSSRIARTTGTVVLSFLCACASPVSNEGESTEGEEPQWIGSSPEADRIRESALRDLSAGALIGWLAGDGCSLREELSVSQFIGGSAESGYSLLAGRLCPEEELFSAIAIRLNGSQQVIGAIGFSTPIEEGPDGLPADDLYAFRGAISIGGQLQTHDNFLTWQSAAGRTRLGQATRLASNEPAESGRNEPQEETCFDCQARVITEIATWGGEWRLGECGVAWAVPSGVGGAFISLAEKTPVGILAGVVIASWAEATCGLMDVGSDVVAIAAATTSWKYAIQRSCSDGSEGTACEPPLCMGDDDCPPLQWCPAEGCSIDYRSCARNETGVFHCCEGSDDAGNGIGACFSPAN